MNMILYMVAMVISLVLGQRVTSNTKIGASDTKFFLPASGSSPDLLSGAAGFGLGLAASQIGGNLINSLGNTGGSCCCGRRKRQAPMSASSVLEEGTTVCAGGRSARSVGRIQNYLALEEAVAVVDITLGASAPPKHSTAMERFKETAEAVTRLADYGATLLVGTVAVETFTAHQGTLTTHGLTMPAAPPMDRSTAGIIL